MSHDAIYRVISRYLKTVKLDVSTHARLAGGDNEKTLTAYPRRIRDRLCTGYGSYQLNNSVVRINFARPMSANEAEIRTLIAAAEAVKGIRDPARTRLCVYGDSQVALRWAVKAGMKVFYRPNRSWRPEFQGAVRGDLYEALRPFAEVVAKWQPRATSVQIFGH